MFEYLRPKRYIIGNLSIWDDRSGGKGPQKTKPCKSRRNNGRVFRDENNDFWPLSSRVGGWSHVPLLEVIIKRNGRSFGARRPSWMGKRPMIDEYKQ